MSELRIRTFQESDRAFVLALMPRLVPERTVSPRLPAEMVRALEQQAKGEQPYPAGTELFVAVIDAEPASMLGIRPDTDYFTAHPRAYVELLAVAAPAEGRGVGRALMAHAEQWARDHACIEVVLDVFASNASAIAFYRRLGYEPDHIRMAKRFRPVSRQEAHRALTLIVDASAGRRTPRCGQAVRAFTIARRKPIGA